VADKRREEFVGRVVKLREEVDQLNQRLDRLEK
jgi:ubiquinone biosynthesis protein UbiJ